MRVSPHTEVCGAVDTEQQSPCLKRAQWQAIIRGGVDKSLARPTYRCRRTESIVSLARGVCSRAELQVFS